MIRFPIVKPAVAYILSMMSTAAPPEVHAKMRAMPGWEETLEERKARYEAIATALYDVVFDASEVPLFDGVDGRSRTAALMVGVAVTESSFAKDVDVGPCYRGGNWRLRCDEGQAACLMQVKVGSGKTAEGYSQADLFADRRKCFRAALRRMRGSFAACRALDRLYWLNAYASGTCDRGQHQSLVRMSRGTSLFADTTRAWTDDAVVMPKKAKAK